jgi:hypothetical protein
MSGNTGKMTAEQIAKRGPRLVLVRLQSGVKVICREGQPCFRSGVKGCIVSRSYSLSYLMNIARHN